jgi:ureidoglycolate lyase
VRHLLVEDLTPENFAPFGWVLGKPYPTNPAATAYSHPGSDFWHEHVFDAGSGGETEVVWVNYRDTSLVVRKLEAHWLTQQAIVPLTGAAVIHVVCPGRADDPALPDLDRLKAFPITPGQGICMRPGCWHASFVREGEATCMMLTRRSTTLELARHLTMGAPAVETSIVGLAGLGEAEICVEL